MDYWGSYCARQALGARGGGPAACFILFHHFYTEKQVYIYYFLKITASRPVGHVFILLAHLQLKYHLNFINDCKHVKK